MEAKDFEEFQLRKREFAINTALNKYPKHIQSVGLYSASNRGYMDVNEVIVDAVKIEDYLNGCYKTASEKKD